MSALARRAALLSLAGHALFLVGLWLLPGADERLADAVPGDLGLVILADEPPPKAPAPEPPEFIMPVLIDPPPTRPTTTPLAGPRVEAGPPPAPAAPAPRPRPGALPTESPGRSVVYLLDRSISMGLSGTLGPARRELRACLESLPPGCRFQVVAYADRAEPLVVNGRQDLLAAEPGVVAQALAKLDALPAEGGTNHLPALHAALRLRPDAVYLLTDHLDLPDHGPAEVTRRNQGRTAIHVVEFVRTRHAVAGALPERLAERNRGTYRRVVLD